MVKDQAGSDKSIVIGTGGSFCSYARGTKLRDELDGHLAAFAAQGVIRPQRDRGIPRQEWDKAIDERLAMCNLILLLVSMDCSKLGPLGRGLATAIRRAPGAATPA